MAARNDATAMPVAARAALLRFTSLGDNCEFGLVQRRAGAEPGGLLRFAFSDLDAVVAGLGDGFADLAAPCHVVVDQPWTDEFITHFGTRGFYAHTWKTPAELSCDQLQAQEARRVPFLRRQLLEELGEAETIFVRKADMTQGAAPQPQQMQALHQALRRFGPNRLLWVEPAQAGHPHGTVRRAAPDLFVGYLDHFAPYGDATAIDFDGWLRLCTQVLALVGAVLPGAIPPSAARIGTEAALHGMGGVGCREGGGVPALHPGAQSFTHDAGAAADTLGAVLHPPARLAALATYTASLWVWLPHGFGGRLIAPLFVGVDSSRVAPAIVSERDRWQRIWVTATLPARDTPVDVGIWTTLAAGDRFHTADWCIEPAPAPGDYWLAGP